MLFLRIGNAENLLALSQPHSLYGDSRNGPWMLRRWGSRTDQIVVGGVAAQSLPQREYGTAGIILPVGSVGVVVSWDRSVNRADEFMIFSTIEGSSFLYKDIVVAMNRETVRVTGYKQEWCFDVKYDPSDQTRLSHIEAPVSFPPRLPSLDHLRVAMQRNMFSDFIDRLGPECNW
jgi:hypothetical protein